MRLEWILMAEGFGTNASGATTAISINQNVVIASSLPMVTKRGVLAHFAADVAEADQMEGKEIPVTAQVIGPSGEVIIGSTVSAVLQPRLFPDLPSGLDITTEFPLRVSDYGTYEIRVTTRPPGQGEITATTYLYVKEPIAPVQS